MNSLTNRTFKKPTVDYSRSKDIKCAGLSKLQDLTRYNSSNYNVYFYKNSPNRDSTPIKVSNTPKTETGLLGPRKTQQQIMLMTIAKSFDNLPMSKKAEYISKASQPSLRVNTSLPLMSQTRIRKIPFILNDYHIRETNPGFARNDFGGFFTH